jgi:G3E family GTPase
MPIPLRRTARKNIKESRSKKKVTRSLKPVPVTLISGFLGSGKTSLLRHILGQKDSGIRYCVIVNEISDFNVDAIAIEQGKLLQTEEKVVEMSNGCICCTLREDLLEKLTEIHKSGRFDRVIIESSGISEPIQVAETFFFPVKGKSLQQGIAPLTHCVSVVDSSTLREYMACNEVPEDGSVSEKDIGSLLFDQLEFANVVVLNKMDLLPDGQEAELIALIQKINPTATIVPAVHSRVELDQLVGAPLFSENMAMNAPGWMDDVINPKSSETEEYGISTFSFRSDRPFHPVRLYDWLTTNFGVAETVIEDSDEENDEQHETVSDTPEDTEDTVSSEGLVERGRARDSRYGKVYRTKGFVWIASQSRLGVCVGWSQAGNVLNLNVIDNWDSLNEDPSQRLVIIGQGLRKEVLMADLESLLLTQDELAMVEEELGSGKTLSFVDPFVSF